VLRDQLGGKRGGVERWRGDKVGLWGIKIVFSEKVKGSKRIKMLRKPNCSWDEKGKKGEHARETRTSTKSLSG